MAMRLLVEGYNGNAYVVGSVSYASNPVARLHICLDLFANLCDDAGEVAALIWTPESVCWRK